MLLGMADALNGISELELCNFWMLDRNEHCESGRTDIHCAKRKENDGFLEFFHCRIYIRQHWSSMGFTLSKEEFQQTKKKKERKSSRKDD